jgi:hypothetical protein
MRLSARVVLCLLALSLAAGSGCRKPLTPNIDRNEAPETWITAAPMDTLTVRDNYGRPVGNPSITTIPVRFHLYWAGSDKDGAVAGFYYAVVETTAVPVDGVFAPLPGPKPGQYRFTTRTDTTFVFTVSELFTDRMHAFYIYAVDNQGKPDPTPARFIFTAIDKFPPRPVIVDAKATGEIVSLTSSGDPIPVFPTPTYTITDTLNPRTYPKDTVPVNSRLDFSWRSEITQPGTVVTGYRYSIDGVKFDTVGASVTAVTYGGLPGSPSIPPGQQIFTLRALDQAGGAGETTRRFMVNFAPDTWWAGPDPARFTGPWDGEYGSHSLDVNQWPSTKDPTFTTNPQLPAGSTFGPDSFNYRPSRRFPPNWDPSSRPRDWARTFYEIYGDRIYARTEGDTVHMNSFVILWNGGYDKDSRYVPRVARATVWDSLAQKDVRIPTDPQLYASGGVVSGEVIDSTGQVGSPIGFRSLIVNRLTPRGLKSLPAQTSLYPWYDPASVYRSLYIGGYWRMFQAGKAYAVARGEDADGGLDNTVKDPVALADAVDNGGGLPADQDLRRKVLVFYVDKAPALVRTSDFRPYEGQAIITRQWDFLLRGMDLDPFDPYKEGPAAGGATPRMVLRFKVALYGKSLPSLGGGDTSWTYIAPTGMPYVVQPEGRDPQFPKVMAAVTSVPISFIPGGTMATNPFDSGPIRVSIEVCDCVDCETIPGQGRCVGGIDPLTGVVPDQPDHSQQNVITVNYTRPASEPALGTTSSTESRPGLDSSGRRDWK